MPSRFLASAFVAGPALMILTFQIIRRVTKYFIGDQPIFTLRMIMTVAMIINMFLLGCEVFTEFYSPTQHAAAAHYLYFGLHGHQRLVPWIWTAMTLNSIGLVLLITPLSRRIGWLEPRLRRLLHRHLDGERHGPHHPRLRAVAARTDRGIPAVAATKPSSAWASGRSAR